MAKDLKEAATPWVCRPHHTVTEAAARDQNTVDNFGFGFMLHLHTPVRWSNVSNVLFLRLKENHTDGEHPKTFKVSL